MLYDVSFVILHTQFQTVPALARNPMPVICTELMSAQGIQALIGRDILQFCLLIFDGVHDSFSLAY